MRTTRPLFSLFRRGAFAGLHRRHERALDRHGRQRRRRRPRGTSGAAGIGRRRRRHGDRHGGRHLDRRQRRRGRPTCGLQNFDVERKPAEILLLLDRSKSMIEDTTSDGVTLKWNAVLPALKQVIMDTDAAVSWGLKTFPEGDGQRVRRRQRHHQRRRPGRADERADGRRRAERHDQPGDAAAGERHADRRRDHRRVQLSQDADHARTRSTSCSRPTARRRAPARPRTAAPRERSRTRR